MKERKPLLKQIPTYTNLFSRVAAPLSRLSSRILPQRLLSISPTLVSTRYLTTKNRLATFQVFSHKATLSVKKKYHSQAFSANTKRSYHASHSTKQSEQAKTELPSKEIIVRQGNAWIVQQHVVERGNVIDLSKIIKYSIVVGGGFLIDIWIKRRAENLAMLKDIRESMEEQYQKNRQLLDKLPIRESQIGFYLYANPRRERLKEVNEQKQELLRLIEQNRRLEERLDNLNMLSWAKSWLPREDYRQMQLLKKEIKIQGIHLNLAWKIQDTFDFYIHQQYDEALESVNEGIRQLSSKEEQGKLSQNKVFLFDKEDAYLLLTALYHMQAKVQRVLKNIPETMAAYKNAIESAKQSQRLITADFRATLSSDHALFLSEEASYKERPDLKITHVDAIKVHQEAYALNPYSPTVVGNYARGLYLQALEITDLTKKQKQLEKAQALLDRAVLANAKSATLLLYRGILLMELANYGAASENKQQYYKQALADFNQGLQEQPGHTSLLCRRAVVSAYLATQQVTDGKEAKEEQAAKSKQVEIALQDVKHLKKALLTKEDRLVDVVSKLATVQQLEQNIENSKVNLQFDCQEGSKKCYAIARFFFKPKAALRTLDTPSPTIMPTK